MFAKFVCAIALIASTGTTVEAVTWEEMLPPKPAAAPRQLAEAPAKQTSPVFVDEMIPGNWNAAAKERYRSWFIGITDLWVKNCTSPILYKVDDTLCESATLLIKSIADLATVADYRSSPEGRRAWAELGGK